MKSQIALCIACFLITQSIQSQNNTLRGKMLYLNSGKTPAVGVEISGSISGMEKANKVYTADNGTYKLIFPNARDGHQVQLDIGEKDANGVNLEVVNAKEVEICRIPAKATDEFEIIVCRKGARDLVAQRYYDIIETSADIALAQKEKEYDELLDQSQKDYVRIKEFAAELAELQLQKDSLSIYREAFDIASINKDNASKRVLRYIQLLDEGKSIQEAREALSIKGAAQDLGASINQFEAAIDELVTRADASKMIFDYQDAISCYDTIISYLERMNIDRLLLSTYYSEAGFTYFEEGLYEKALDYQQETIFILEEILKDKDPSLAAAYDNIGNTYQASGNYQKAIEYQLEAVNIGEEIFDPFNSDLATIYNNIANTYQALGNYHEALEYQLKSLNIRKKIFDSNHLSLATIYGNIGNTYRFLGEYKKALEYQLKSLSIRKEKLDSNHLALAISYNNSALIYSDLGAFEKALEYIQKCVAIRKEVLNSRHPDLAGSYTNYASIYKKLSENQEALEYQLDAINIWKEIFPPNHPDLATAFSNVSTIYRALKNFQKALKYQQDAIAIREEVLDSKHSYLATSYSNIALIYQDLEEYQKALEYQQKALAIQKEELPVDHPNLAISYWSIAITFKEMDRYKEAIDHQDRAITILKTNLGENHSYVRRAFEAWLGIYHAQALDAFHNKDPKTIKNNLDTLYAYTDHSKAWDYLGDYYYHTIDYSKAIEAYHEAVKISPEIKEEEFYSSIGMAYAKNKQFKEAENAFREYEKLFPSKSISYRNWAMLYALQGNENKALQNLQKAIELGYDDIDWLKIDSSMNILRKEKAFIDLVTKLEKD